MNGKICLVTGATRGIGLETARALAAAGATVVLHGRDPQRARAAAARVAADTGSPRVRPVYADFSQLARVRALAEELDATLPRLDVLVNNAGMMSAGHGRSAEGYDLTFAVNHLAPFLLTNLLLPKLCQSAPARVVVVASAAHRRARLDFADLMNERVTGLWPAYARSKLANMLFARALAERLDGTQVTVNCLHPGLVRSHLFHDGPPWMQLVMGAFGRLFMLSARDGARTSVYLATAPGLAGRSGGYYVDCRPAQPSVAARDEADAARLWWESARLTGIDAR
jgi:NAD(P)-dependent dehydrogenase (short-subunit alcohol dehydrogenase family)